MRGIDSWLTTIASSAQCNTALHKDDRGCAAPSGLDPKSGCTLCIDTLRSRMRRLVECQPNHTWANSGVTVSRPGRSSHSDDTSHPERGPESSVA